MLRNFTKNPTLIIRGLLLVAVVCSMNTAQGCSGEDSLAESTNGQSTFDVSTAGGTIELHGVVTIKFPKGAFKNDMGITLRENEVDERINQLISSLPSTPFHGRPYKNVIVIISSAQPSQDAIIQYTISDDFLQQLDSQYEPILVANVIQGGDEEKIDDFENIEATLSGNVLTAKLPPWLFSDEYSDTNGAFRATILLGSQPKVPSNNFKSFFLKSEGFCNGSLIGSPLAGDLEITSSFGLRTHPISKKEKNHSGTDFRIKIGDNVLSVAEGTVKRVSFDYNAKAKTGYGWYVVLLHAGGSETLYAHLEEGSTDNLHVGDEVKQGDIIGSADTSGGATGPHLHFGYKVGGRNIDPVPCIAPSVKPITFVSLEMGETSYGPSWYGMGFEIHLNIPEGNGIGFVECKQNTTNTDYHCSCSEYLNGVSGSISITGGRGALNATCQITDLFGSLLSVPIDTSWDCCNHTDTGFVPSYICNGDFEHNVKIKSACFTLGDCADYCGIN